MIGTIEKAITSNEMCRCHSDRSKCFNFDLCSDFFRSRTHENSYLTAAKFTTIRTLNRSCLINAYFYNQFYLFFIVIFIWFPKQTWFIKTRVIFLFVSSFCYCAVSIEFSVSEPCANWSMYYTAELLLRFNRMQSWQ